MIAKALHQGTSFASAEEQKPRAIPPIAVCYWVGEAMGSTDFKDLPETPEMIAKTAAMLASNAAHLAGLLKQAPYPG